MRTRWSLSFSTHRGMSSLYEFSPNLMQKALFYQLICGNCGKLTLSRGSVMNAIAHACAFSPQFSTKTFLQPQKLVFGFKAKIQHLNSGNEQKEPTKAPVYKQLLKPVAFKLTIKQSVVCFLYGTWEWRQYGNNECTGTLDIIITRPYSGK